MSCRKLGWGWRLHRSLCSQSHQGGCAHVQHGAWPLRILDQEGLHIVKHDLIACDVLMPHGACACFLIRPIVVGIFLHVKVTPEAWMVLLRMVEVLNSGEAHVWVSGVSDPDPVYHPMKGDTSSRRL